MDLFIICYSVLHLWVANLTVKEENAILQLHRINFNIATSNGLMFVGYFGGRKVAYPGML